MHPNSEDDVADAHPSPQPRLRWDPVVLLPVVLVSVPLIAIYTDTAAHWTAMIRPMAIAMATVFTVTVLAAALTRRPLAASIVVAAVVLLVLELRIGGRFPAHPRCRGIGPKDATASARHPTILSLDSDCPIGWSHPDAVVHRGHRNGVDDLRIGAAAERAAAGSTARPNVYVLLLDGYPRQDSLSDIGLDNSPSLRTLSTSGSPLTVRRRQHSRGRS